MQNLNLKFQKKLPKFPMRYTGGFSFLPFLSPLGTWIMKIYISVMEGFFEVDASTSILWNQTEDTSVPKREPKHFTF